MRGRDSKAEEGPPDYIKTLACDGDDAVPLPLGTDGVRGGQRLIPMVVASSLFMDLMDTSALATAMPTLAQAYGTNPVNLKLALTAYLATVAVLVPASGWLSARFGAKRLFMTAMGLFVLGSLCCGLANSLTQLIAARILQGVGGSMMTPVGRSIVVASAPRTALVRAMGWFALPAILAPMVGPPLAGLLLEAGSWRWIFWINVPVGLLGICAIAWFVPPMPGRMTDRRFDALGFLVAGVAIIAAVAVIETNGLSGWRMSARLASVFFVIVMIGVYVYHARRNPSPIIDLTLLRLDTLRVSLSASWLQRMAMGATTFLLPLQLQIGLGLSPLIASQVLVAMAFGSILARFLVPPLIDRAGFRASLILFGIGSALFSMLPACFSPQTPIWLMMLGMFCMSLLRSSFFIPAGTMAYADVKGENVGHASVLFTVAQQLSIGMGVTLAATLLEETGHGGDAMAASGFVLPFLLLALLSAIATLLVVPMRADAGAHLRNRPRG
jgi:EmrB/QacA subfamily drug resistance transporter